MCLLKVFVQKSIPRTTLPGIDFSAFFSNNTQKCRRDNDPRKSFSAQKRSDGDFFAK
jgi:hypothetical protein